MTSLAVYGSRGRKLIFIHAMWNAYDEWTDGDLGWDDVTAAGYLAAAGTALVIPDPGSTLLGWGATKGSLLAKNLGYRVGAAGARVAARATVVLAPVAAGAAIGATIGTAVSQVIWGDEGAQTALGFYSMGTLPGTEAPDLSNFQYIFKPTAPGGPQSLYDIVTSVPIRAKFYNF